LYAKILKETPRRRKMVTSSSNEISTADQPVKEGDGLKLVHQTMEETPRRRKTVTSSFHEISTDQLGNRVMVRGEALLFPHPSEAGFWTDF
jgi:hypothetical protein